MRPAHLIWEVGDANTVRRGSGHCGQCQLEREIVNRNGAKCVHFGLVWHTLECSGYYLLERAIPYHTRPSIARYTRPTHEDTDSLVGELYDGRNSLRCKKRDES